VVSRVLLGDVAKERRETCKGSKDEFPIVGLEHLIPEEITLTTWDEGKENTFSKLFREGDILFGRRRAYLKKAAVAPFDGICSGDITVIEAIAERMLPELLPFIIQNDALFDFAVGKSAGSLSPRVKWENLKNYEFELPNIDKQHELVKILWAIDITKKTYRKLLQKTDELVKSQFVEMFGDPLKNDRGWPIESLGKLGELNRGVSKHRPRNTPELIGGPYPLIQTGEISNAGTYITNYENTYSEAGLAQSRMWPKGTLCITIAANIAQTAILTFDACFPDSVVGFISGPKTNQIFVHYWFSFFQKLLEEQAPQVAQKNINLKTLNDLLVLAPPLPLQNQFATFVEQADKSKIELEQALKELDSTYKKIISENLG
jgi:type I restriction enzyme, S subunit